MSSFYSCRIRFPILFLWAIALLGGLGLSVIPVCQALDDGLQDPLGAMVSGPWVTGADRAPAVGEKREKAVLKIGQPASSAVNPVDRIRQLLAERSAPDDGALAAAVRQRAVHRLKSSHPAGNTLRIGFASDAATPRLIKFHRGTRSKARRRGATSDSRKAAREFLRSNRTLLGLHAPDDELVVKRQWVDRQGNAHLRFQQTVSGVPVWGREAMVHLDETDTVYLFQGRHEASPAPGVVATTPGIDADDATSALLMHLGRTFALNAPAELVLRADENGDMALCYRVDLTLGLTERWIYFVDAATGAVRHRISGIRNELVSSSGADINGVQRTFNAWSQGGTDYLVDPSMPLADPPYQPIPEIKSRGNTYILTAGNGDGDELDHVKRSSGTIWDAAGVSAISAVMIVDDYYQNTHGRHGIDNEYMNYLVVVHFGQNEANAFWNGKFVVLGDGDGQTFSSLAGSLDVMAHEIQHGVTEFSAGLIYENQSGALNEAYSDIFACMVDRDDWTIGEDVTLLSPGYLRNLANPALGLSALPTKMSQYRNLPNTEAGDWGGVHINMSIPSRAAYLMADGLSAEGLGARIGRDKTEKIFYRALTTYLQSSSDFQDARVATVQAAEDLYGEGSAEVAAVKAAWDGVEVADGTVTPDDADPTSTEATAGQDMMVYLYPTDGSHTPWLSGETYHLFGQTIPMPFTGYDPALDRRLYGGPVAYSRPAVYTDADGTLVFFIDTGHNLWGVNADGTGHAERITTAGDTHSFAISPDGKAIAYTTTSADDNNIYVGDIETGALRTYALEPFSDLPPGEYGVINTIFYADSLAFDYSGKRIVFDALNCISTPDDPCSITGGGHRYWSIGILDLTTGALSFPFPNQSPDYDIAYPTFAANNNYVIALDVLDYSEYNQTGAVHSSVWTMNLKTQTSQRVANPDKGTNHYPICGTPSFWGDDDAITVQMADDTGGTAYRVPVDAAWQGDENNSERLNDYDVALPVMHRVAVRTLSGTLTPSAWSLNFPAAGSGQTEIRELTLSNTGNRDIRITNIAIAGSTAFTHNGINQLLAQGKSMTVRVVYSPASGTGEEMATLSVASDADNPRIDIVLEAAAAEAGWRILATGANDIGIRALIHTEENGTIQAVWKKGGQADLPVGRLIWGYFYADPDEVSWGDPDNPEMFVKILVGPAEEWVNVDYFHVSVPDIEVFTDYPADGTADGHDTATGPNAGSLRFVEHTFVNGVLADESTVQAENGLPGSVKPGTANPTGYPAAGDVRIGAMIEAVSEADSTRLIPIEGIWKKGGEADTAIGKTVWGYFYADPSQVSWGSPDNPELFVKLLVGDGWMIANYFHVSVPTIDVYCDYGADQAWENSAAATLDNRFIEYRY